MNDNARAGPEQRYDASPYVPAGADLAGLRGAAAGCRGCPLHRGATRTVFGAGEASASVVLVGEQPGDQEDRQGRPFVGPAGRVLTRALADAGIDPDDTYVTNAVKHFKFSLQERGRRRMHESPTHREVTACRPWLVAELRLVLLPPPGEGLPPRLLNAKLLTAGRPRPPSSRRNDGYPRGGQPRAVALRDLRR